MAIPIRYVAIVVVIFILLLVTFKSLNGHRIPSLFSSGKHPANASDDHHSLIDTTPYTNSDEPKRANATLFMLCRNSEIEEVIHSIRSIEDRFNRKFGYPYVFLNEVPFDEEFKKRVSVLPAAPMEFGLIPHDDWYAPPWIDEEEFAEARRKMAAIPYGSSIPYRNMCRFNSGFFFRHPLLEKYRYYWRIEPKVTFYCDIPSDPFLFMQDHNKTYGFTISILEYEPTIPTLWETVKEYTKQNPKSLDAQNSVDYVSDDGGDTYNLCQFWSNFEIADMEFWRGETYMSFFEFLDKAGGFYYERWGDAPVHSIAASLFLPRSALHFFDDIGYQHPPFTHCPKDEQLWAENRCSCNPATNFDYEPDSCLRKWDAVLDEQINLAPTTTSI